MHSHVSETACSSAGAAFSKHTGRTSAYTTWRPSAPQRPAVPTYRTCLSGSLCPQEVAEHHLEAVGVGGGAPCPGRRVRAQLGPALQHRPDGRAVSMAAPSGALRAMCRADAAAPAAVQRPGPSGGGLPGGGIGGSGSRCTRKSGAWAGASKDVGTPGGAAQPEPGRCAQGQPAYLMYSSR